MPGDNFGKELTERPRATTQDALNPHRYSSQSASHADAVYIGAQAQRNGAIAAASSAFISSGAVYLMNELSPKFRGALGISGKLALVVTPTAGAFFLRSHLTVAEARADPDFLAAKPDAPASQPSTPQHSLAAWQQAANFIYYNPFKLIGAISIPLYGFVFYRESTQASTASMPLSQRLMHTRVYGQMIAVLTTVSVMGFVKGMDAEGIYRIEDGVLVRGEKSSRQGFAYRGLVPTRSQHEAKKASQAPGSSDADAAVSKEKRDAAREKRDALARKQEEERIAAVEEAEMMQQQSQSRGDSMSVLMVPLFYAPIVPLMRVMLRGRVPTERLTQMTLGVIAVGLAHAGSIMFSDSSVAYRR
jgi:hypothetical protein